MGPHFSNTLLGPFYSCGTGQKHKSPYAVFLCCEGNKIIRHRSGVGMCKWCDEVDCCDFVVLGEGVGVSSQVGKIKLYGWVCRGGGGSAGGEEEWCVGGEEVRDYVCAGFASAACEEAGLDVSVAVVMLGTEKHGVLYLHGHFERRFEVEIEM